ncbi:MAG: hypothetical protein LC541_16780, partial [Candidatus Thiodiazotropha sp.]|nr:hypothetical protein [Candidatus Thiodiazotropha sp.]MCM8884925.1 hypothetical protein [Candidatus Thiodiazotropha sp.]MCM8920748.1 hypothetical protein [Candidatus Thiodiazotropha sp.]
MPKPRKEQVSLDVTPYYHRVSRCVMRAYLCGEDALTGRSFEHRRQWIQDKLFALNDVFAIDLCSYAILSNHFHWVLFMGLSGFRKEIKVLIGHRFFSIFDVEKAS